ncbi:MAG: HAMP domain-containing histidine kinase [Deltaproteobacteria bacterium]|nr:HAMP domain-containing histidine kinase [Deltaproteobacteria bacterium]
MIRLSRNQALRGEARTLLLRLRWFAFVGQCVALVALFFAIGGRSNASGLERIQILGIAAVALVTALTNLMLRAWPMGQTTGEEARRPARVSTHLSRGRGIEVPAFLLLDVLLLTVLLALTGGPSNPFSILYLIHVVLAAVLARPVWTWSVAILSSASFGSLFFLSMPSPLRLSGHAHSGSGFGSGLGYDFHLQGMWAAFTLAAIVVAAFSARLAAELRLARDEQAKTERLAGLATLAAGAAHEIGNPLATIRIAVGELKVALEELGVEDAHLADLRLIDAEVSRAHAVLRRMTMSAGEMNVEVPAPIELSRVLDNAREQLGREASRVAISFEPDDPRSAVHWPEQATTQVLVQLLRNALAASDSLVRTPDGEDAWSTSRRVLCRARLLRDRVEIEIQDRGVGMSPDVLERVGQPFFTTRPKAGMGLGVFLARSMAEQLGGTLTFRSTPGVGTSVCFSVPLNVGSSPESR